MGRKTAQGLPDLQDILKTLGETLHLARLRRHITAAMLAERAGMTRNTLRSVERGESGVTLGAYASVLFCLGLEKDLLLIGKDDPLGRKLQDIGLTHTKMRVSRRRQSDILKSVREWSRVAEKMKFPSRKLDKMKNAFRNAD